MAVFALARTILYLILLVSSVLTFILSAAFIGRSLSDYGVCVPSSRPLRPLSRRAPVQMLPSTTATEKPTLARTLLTLLLVSVTPRLALSS